MAEKRIIRLGPDQVREMRGILPMRSDAYVWHEVTGFESGDSFVELPEEMRPSFRIRPMTVAERNRWRELTTIIARAEARNRVLVSRAVHEGKAQAEQLDTKDEEHEMLRILSDCVTDWRNLQSPGEDILFGSLEFEALPDWVKAELGRVLVELSGLSKPEIENLS